MAIWCMTICFFLVGQLRTDFAEERQDMPCPAHNKLESLHTYGEKKIVSIEAAQQVCSARPHLVCSTNSKLTAQHLLRCLLTARHDRQRSVDVNSMLSTRVCSGCRLQRKKCPSPRQMTAWADLEHQSV